MEDNNQIIIDNKKEEEEECKNEEKDNKLLLENNKNDNKNNNINDNINENINDNINDIEEKEFKIKEPFLNDNVKNWNNEQINNIKIENNNNVVIGDYIITIQYTKLFHIPYFIFGNIFNFYCPCKKFNSEKINLSQIPTPPFGIVLTDCK